MRVPFPFVEDNRRRFRPGLVVSPGIVDGAFGLLWVVMITGAGHEGWVDDVEIGADHAAFGLHIPSVVRVAKIAAIDIRQASKVGRMKDSVTREDPVPDRNDPARRIAGTCLKRDRR